MFLSIPGPFVSGNHAKTRDGRRTSDARAFDEKVALLARAAVREQGWKMPEYVRVTVTLINVRIDADNFCKEAMDPLQGIVFPFDSRIVELHVVKRHIYKAAHEARVSVEAVPGKDYGYPRPLRAL